jgi:enediyne biosynthesis protein E7
LSSTEADLSADDAPVRRLEVTRPGLPPLAGRQFDVASTEDSLEQLVACTAAHGDLYRVYAPGRKRDTWIVNHPDDIKRLLVTNHRNFTKGVGLDRVKILLGNGIMVSEGDFWKRQRRMIQPAFHRRMVEQYATTIDACLDDALPRWDAAAASGTPFDITEEMSGLTLDIVLRSIFSVDLAWLAEQTGGNPFAIVTEHSARDLAFAYKFRSLAKLVVALVARRRAEGLERFDFLQMLMDARDKETGAPMSEKQLIDEAMTLIVAGHETTASGLNWTWYLLSQNPEAEKRLHAEIDAAAEKAEPSLSEMEELTYTRNVVDEALRLYPPGWLLSRRTIAPDTLCGFEVPAGTDVLLCPYLLHRHPRYWKEPDDFRPERFDAEHESERPRFAYMPFAAGPRHCIGESLALYEMYMHLYKVARRYRLTYVPDKPLELEAQINLRTKHPLMMKLERRS